MINIKTEIKIEFKNLKTALLIINYKDEYDFLTYNHPQKTYLNQGFTKESFIVTEGEYNNDIAQDLVERLRIFLSYYTLRKLMYCNKLTNFLDLKTQFTHIPDEYTFVEE